MNIILGSHYFHPHIGGIESVVESHARGLSKRGHNVTVVSSNIGASHQISYQQGYEVRRFNAWNPVEAIGLPYPIPSPLSLYREHIRKVFNEDIDIVHVHGLNYLTTLAVLQKAPADCPIVLHQHTPYVEYSFFVRILERINDYVIGKLNIRRSDIVLCVNSNIEKYVLKLSPEADTEIMMNGIDVDFFSPNQDSRASRFNCSPTTPVFFTLSRMSQKKGIDVLMDAIEKVNQTEVDAHFVIAGDGPLRREVEQATQIHPNIEVLGKLSNNDLAECYASADAFLFTSKSGEAFPTLTMIESFSSGTPVIASRLSEDAVGVYENQNTVLYDPGDSNELARIIRRLAGDVNRLKKMGRVARMTAIEEFSIESKIDQLESVYHRLCDK